MRRAVQRAHAALVRRQGGYLARVAAGGARALELYKGSASYAVNAWLRGGPRLRRLRQARGLPARFLRALAGALSRVADRAPPLGAPLRVWRVVSGRLARTLARARPGERVSDPGFMSWTFDPRCALEYAAGGGGARTVLLEATLPAGARALYVDGARGRRTGAWGGRWVHQAEVLLGRGATLTLAAPAPGAGLWRRQAGRGRRLERLPAVPVAVEA